MYKAKQFYFALISVLILSIFAGCQPSGITGTEDMLPSTDSSQSTEATDDSTVDPADATESTSEAAEPTLRETICPRTIDYFKSHLMPYMTYEEALAILGAKDKEISNIPNYSEAVWYLENEYYIYVEFYPTKNDNMYDFIATVPTDETNPDGTPVDDLYYLGEWWRHMEAYRAILYKGSTTGKREQVEVWFDHGYGPFWKQEG